jgi:hypothetical protein
MKKVGKENTDMHNVVTSDRRSTKNMTDKSNSQASGSHNKARVGK